MMNDSHKAQEPQALQHPRGIYVNPLSLDLEGHMDKGHMDAQALTSYFCLVLNPVLRGGKFLSFLVFFHHFQGPVESPSLEHCQAPDATCTKMTQLQQENNPLHVH